MHTERGMMTQTHLITRFDSAIPGSWAGVVGAFEAAVPAPDPAAVMQLVKDHADLASVREWMTTVAPHGLLTFWKDANILVPLFGHQLRCVTFTVGNIAIAETLYRHDPGVLQYVPVRLALHETGDGTVLLSFDQPSTTLASLDNSEITEIGLEIDHLLAGLLTQLGAEVPSGLA